MNKKTKHEIEIHSSQIIDSVASLLHAYAVVHDNEEIYDVYFELPRKPGLVKVTFTKKRKKTRQSNGDQT